MLRRLLMSLQGCSAAVTPGLGFTDRRVVGTFLTFQAPRRR
jgi:hypothetical protein